jgi:hypothetical protein
VVEPVLVRLEDLRCPFGVLYYMVVVEYVKRRVDYNHLRRTPYHPPYILAHITNELRTLLF